MGSFSGAPKPLGTAVDTENGTLNIELCHQGQHNHKNSSKTARALTMILSAPLVILTTIPILIILGISGPTNLISSSLSSSLLSLSGADPPAPQRISSLSDKESHDPGYYYPGHYQKYYRREAKEPEEGRQAGFGGNLAVPLALAVGLPAAIMFGSLLFPQTSFLDVVTRSGLGLDDRTIDDNFEKILKTFNGKK